jgi:hypothetical protein
MKKEERGPFRVRREDSNLAQGAADLLLFQRLPPRIASQDCRSAGPHSPTDAVAMGFCRRAHSVQQSRIQTRAAPLQSRQASVQGPCLWVVQLDFSNTAIGETANLVVEAIVREDSFGPEFDRREWWRYEVDGDPELAAAWILLPEDNRYTNFTLVKYDYKKDAQVTIVQPTRQSVIRHGTVRNWAIVHPDAGVTYSCRWKLQLSLTPRLTKHQVIAQIIGRLRSSTSCRTRECRS